MPMNCHPSLPPQRLSNVWVKSRTVPKRELPRRRVRGRRRRVGSARQQGGRKEFHAGASGAPWSGGGERRRSRARGRRRVRWPALHRPARRAVRPPRCRGAARRGRRPRAVSPRARARPLACTAARVHHARLGRSGGARARAGAERLLALVPHRALLLETNAPNNLLDLSSLPILRLRRPHDFSSLEETVDVLLGGIAA
jgi:hypothetical protein